MLIQKQAFKTKILHTLAGLSYLLHLFGYLTTDIAQGGIFTLGVSSRRVRTIVERTDAIPFKKVLTALLSLEQKGQNITLLGVCPLSEKVIRAALTTARAQNSPVVFVATREQVDVDGGYTGWNQKELVNLIYRIAEEIGFNGPVYIARDHGGPWLRFAEFNAKLTEREAMERAKASFAADIEAGFSVFHIDATVDPWAEGRKPTLDVIIKRTVELIEFIIEKSQGKEISLEVGIEGIEGRLTNPTTLEAFLIGFKRELRQRNLGNVWPDFIVVQTGTNLGLLEQLGKFNPTLAKQLVGVARDYNVNLKQHDTDYSATEDLILMQASRIKAANAGPEFAAEEMRLYLDLERREREMLSARGRLSEASNLSAKIKKVIAEKGLWQKWIDKDESQLTDGDWERIVLALGRYAFSDSRIKITFQKLFDNVKSLEIASNPEKLVVEGVEKAIIRYMDAFSLKDSFSLILSEINGP